MRTPTRVLVVCGTGAHTDSWHDLAATSRALAATLTLERDVEVEVCTTDELEQTARPHLVVVNASGDLDAPPVDSRRTVESLLALHASGAPLLAVHSSAYAFRDDPRWAELIGGRWQPGVSGHPPLGGSTIHWQPGNPLGTEGSFTVIDERYTGLQHRVDALIAAHHEHEGADHPLVWLNATPTRSAYSALGHDPRSYTSAGHRTLLGQLTGWLLERDLTT